MYGLSDHLKAIPRTWLRAERHASSRYSTGMAEILEHTFERITLPLPSGPKHVHCWVVEGERGRMLVDTGMGLPGDEESFHGLEVDAIVLTHMHPDHVGGAQRAADLTGAPVHQLELDYRQCLRVWGSDDWPERIAEWFLSNGVPREITDELIVSGHAFAPSIRFVRDPQLVAEGDVLDGWEVLWLPGHADGHIALYRDGALVCGDVLLSRISPAIGLYPESRPDPLGDYLRTLERIVELDPRIAYSGHGEPVEHPAERARELVKHHRRRLDETRGALDGGPADGYAVSKTLFGDALSPTQRRFAVAETLSHLERLVAEGAAARESAGGTVTYTAI
jgi:glyoxylase-like metal-dependent hydrolase (beta-lactamase superfamily II)